MSNFLLTPAKIDEAVEGVKAFQGFKEAKTTWPDDAALRKYLERNKAKA